MFQKDTYGHHISTQAAGGQRRDLEERPPLCWGGPGLPRASLCSQARSRPPGSPFPKRCPSAGAAGGEPCVRDLPRRQRGAGDAPHTADSEESQEPRLEPPRQAGRRSPDAGQPLPSAFAREPRGRGGPSASCHGTVLPRDSPHGDRQTNPLTQQSGRRATSRNCSLSSRVRTDGRR